jgi:hypothetical protein
MITHYFKFIKNPDRKTRFDLVAYSIPAYENESFNPLVKPFIYAGRNPYIKANAQRKSELQISWKGKNLSSVYFIDIENPELAYGDINNSKDLIIFVIKDEIIEMFILRDNKNHLNMIIDFLNDNELNPEMEYLRNNAICFDSVLQSLNS